MDKKLTKKIVIISASILALGVVVMYSYEWIRLMGKEKIEDEGFDIYIDKENQ
jgi:hypothetical protein